MPRVGQVRVRLTTELAALAGAWLLGPYREQGLRNPVPDDQDRARATELGLQLQNAALRKRSVPHFTILVDRDAAWWFGGMWEVVIYRGLVFSRVYAPVRVREAMRSFLRAAKATPGRPRLTRGALEDRVTGVVRHLDTRQRKRLRQRRRRERAWDEWDARGNTIAGSAGTDDPPPKI